MKDRMPVSAITDDRVLTLPGLKTPG
ncbi:MAG: hypothetical protein JWR09_2453, partial [Mucilaginibacter sp.]|nr:hypothetical protein [Mucilaginibacter sp.]